MFAFVSEIVNAVRSMCTIETPGLTSQHYKASEAQQF